MKSSESILAPYIQTIKALDFVKNIQIKKEAGLKQLRTDGQLTIATARGKYPFVIEQKSSYLDRAFVNSIISQSKKHRSSQGKPLLLLARYVPRPSAERLIENGINFVDQAGNMHLVVGINYARTIIGRKETTTFTGSTSLTATGIQLLFTFAINQDAGRWSVRELAEASGIGKSNVAKIRRQFVDRGLLQESAGTFNIRNKKELEQELLRGYSDVLRPKLVINRFRAASSSNRETIRGIHAVLAKSNVRWSLTGGPASYELQHFYQGPEIPIFIQGFSDALVRELRLLPDVHGPIILFRSFGTAPFWKMIAQKMIAHPWLIYSELMYSADPRAHEAAAELKEELLQW